MITPEYEEIDQIQNFAMYSVYFRHILHMPYTNETYLQVRLRKIVSPVTLIECRLIVIVLLPSSKAASNHHDGMAATNQRPDHRLIVRLGLSLLVQVEYFPQLKYY